MSYSGDALEVATYFESKGAWDSLMEFAAKCDITEYCDGDLMAKLQDKQSNHMSSIYSTNSNRQVLVASVDANKHGMKYINEKRGWSDIEVEVEEIFLGLPGKENVIQAVLDELGIPMSVYKNPVEYEPEPVPQVVYEEEVVDELVVPDNEMIAGGEGNGGEIGVMEGGGEKSLQATVIDDEEEGEDKAEEVNANGLEKNAAFTVPGCVPAFALVASYCCLIF